MGIVYQVQNKFESYGKPSYIMCPFFPACAKKGHITCGKYGGQTIDKRLSIKPINFIEYRR